MLQLSAEARARLAPLRKRLLAEREKRPPPLKDDKVLLRMERPLDRGLCGGVQGAQG